MGVTGIINNKNEFIQDSQHMSFGFMDREESKTPEYKRNNNDLKVVVRQKGNKAVKMPEFFEEEFT